jgi:fatty acid desaturase
MPSGSRNRGQNYGGLVQKVSDLERRMAEDENEARDAAIARSDLAKRVEELEKQAASWVGGFWAIAAVGAVVTFIAAFWDKITLSLRHP